MSLFDLMCSDCLCLGTRIDRGCKAAGATALSATRAYNALSFAFPDALIPLPP